jgi:hypothetical protein
MSEGLVFPEISQHEQLRGLLYPRESRKGSANSARNTRFRLLDLFCCAGGAGIGYKNAGFEFCSGGL